MFRRFISFLVVAGLFAGQLATVPHAHAGMSMEEQHEHDGTPHLHVGGHSHSHELPSYEYVYPSERDQRSHDASLPDVLTDSSHDSTAVYSPEPTTSASVNQPQASNPLLFAGLAMLAVCQPLADLNLRGCAPRMSHPPDKVLDESDLFLTLRNLRI